MPVSAAHVHHKQKSASRTVIAVIVIVVAVVSVGFGGLAVSAVCRYHNDIVTVIVLFDYIQYVAFKRLLLAVGEQTGSVNDLVGVFRVHCIRRNGTYNSRRY